MKDGFFCVATAAPKVSVGDVEGNLTRIKELISEANASGADAIVFPEMSITAYTCGDLFHSSTLLDAADSAICRLTEFTADKSTLVVVGAPLRYNNTLYNCAAIIYGGKLIGFVPKTYIPNYNEFYEKRWFASAPTFPEGSIEIHHRAGVCKFGNIIFNFRGVGLGVEICEDLWSPVPPSTYLAMAGAELIFNLSASDDLIGKYDYLTSLISQQSARCIAGYAYASAGFGESSTDLVFNAKLLIAENGSILKRNKRWETGSQLIMSSVDIEAIKRDRLHNGSFTDCSRRNNLPVTIVEISDDNPAPLGQAIIRNVKAMPFVPSDDADLTQRCEEIINIQVAGLAKRLDATGTKKLVIGISGGLDSTLALLVATRTYDLLGLDRKGIIGVTMPGFGTTGRTYRNAITLMETLSVTIREINIGAAVLQHFKDIGHDPNETDVTYENSQARERTQILMDIANQTGGMVLGTGDLSELALGWATYNGDHMSMYGVNSGVPKTLVQHLTRFFATTLDNTKTREALLDILDTPISPELIPASADGTISQKTEDLVGPYELHDFFLYYTLRYGFSPRRIYTLSKLAGLCQKYGSKEVKRWLSTFFRRFFNQQFKRSCLPDGPKVGSVCLSPRGDWRMPSDANSSLWMKECRMLIEESEI